MVATVTFLGSTYSTTTTQNPNTSGALSFGPEASDRIIAVAIMGRAAGQTVISGVTIGGVAATQAATLVSNGNTAAIWFAQVPTGTSGVVSVTTTVASFVRMAFTLYALTGVSPSVQASKSVAAGYDGTTDRSLVTTITPASAGVAIGVAYAGNSTNPPNLSSASGPNAAGSVQITDKVTIGTNASTWTYLTKDIDLALTAGSATGDAVMAVASWAVSAPAVPGANPDSAAQQQTSTSPSFVSKTQVAPDSVAQPQSSTSPSLFTRAALSPDVATQPHSATSTSLAVGSTLAPANGLLAQVASVSGLAARASLMVQSIVQAQVAAAASLASRSQLIADSAAQLHALAIATLTAAGDVLRIIATGFALVGTGRRFNVVDPGRRFSAVDPGRQFTIISKGKRMPPLRFPTKYPDEVRNASVDLSAELATGESFTGNAAVSTTIGDVVVSSIGRAGGVVTFQMSGGTVAAALDHLIKVACHTDSGQLVEVQVIAPIRNS